MTAATESDLREIEEALVVFQDGVIACWNDENASATDAERTRAALHAALLAAIKKYGDEQHQAGYDEAGDQLLGSDDD